MKLRIIYFIILSIFFILMSCTETNGVNIKTPCDGVTCSDNGECLINKENKAICLCDDNYHAKKLECIKNTQNCEVNQHEDGNTCVDNKKIVDCIDVSPENASKIDSKVEITWSNGNWSEASDCDWTCKKNYHKFDNTCIENTTECTGIQEGETCRCEAGAWWDLDFNSDPTLLNWHLRDDSVFDTSELSNGIWKASDGELLDTTPNNSFDKSTSIHLKFKNTTIGGKGAVFWINADFTTNKKASIYASLTLQDNNTQTLTIYAKNNDGEVELVNFPNLSINFIDLWLLIDVDTNNLTVWVENELKGTYSYPIYDSSSDPFATLVAWGSRAEFDSIRIETCSDGAKHPEIIDTTAPIITLNGDNPMNLIVNHSYTELGATAIDNIDGELDVTISGSVNTNQIGEYTITYSATDSSGNNTSIERKVYVNDEPNIECETEGVRCVGSTQEYTTIQSAIDAASVDDIIMIFSGTYYEQVLVSKNLTIKAVENNDVIISGEKNLTSWQYDNARNLYYTNSPCEDVQMLFINGEEKKAARYPNEGYFIVDNSPSKSKFSLENFDLTNNDIKDSMAHIRMSQWRLASRRVTSYENGYINLESEAISDFNNITPEYKVFFTQVISAIDSNNEWAWNNNKIYIRSSSTPQNVTIACNEHGIYLDDGATNIKISGLNITKIKGNGIGKKPDTRKLASDDILIENNNISYVSGWGIMIRDFYKQYERLPADTIIQGNEIHHARTGGMRIFADNALVDSNYVHDIGASKLDDDVLAFGDNFMLSGIFIENSSGAKVSNNRINNTGYNGISLSNFWHGWMSNGDRIVENNYVSNAMLALNDGAGIYAHIQKEHDVERGVEPERDIIRNNIVENCIGSFAGTNDVDTSHRAGEGIYLDDASSHVDVYGNTVIGATKNLFLNRGNYDITARNNTFISPFGQSIYLAERNGKKKKNVFINNNKILSGDKWTYQLILDIGIEELLMEINSNIFRVDDEVEVKYGYGSHVDTNSFENWKNSGYDEDSIVIQNSSKPVILINPSLNNVIFNNLEGCLKFDNTALNNSSAIVEPYHSLILFECTNYTPDIYTNSY